MTTSYSKGLKLRSQAASPVSLEHNITVGISFNKEQAQNLITATSRFLADAEAQEMRITVHKNNCNENGMHTTIIKGK